MLKNILSSLSNVGSGFMSGFSAKFLLFALVIASGLAVSAFIGLTYYQKAYLENIEQKAQIQASFNQTRIILEKQNEAIRNANAKLESYQKEIASIKKATAKKFAEIEKRRVETCTDFSKAMADLLKTYEDSIRTSTQGSSNE